VVLTNLETHIFTTPPTFHGPTISNHDLKIIDGTDMEISFLGNAMMNKIIGASTVNKDDDLLMFNVTNYVKSLGSRDPSEIIQGNDRFEFERSEGGVMSLGSGDSATGAASTSSSQTPSKMAIKIFCYLQLCVRKYLSSQL
jgi:hypothetical protein